MFVVFSFVLLPNLFLCILLFGDALVSGIVFLISFKDCSLLVSLEIQLKKFSFWPLCKALEGLDPSSPTRGQTYAPVVDAWAVNHWTARKSLIDFCILILYPIILLNLKLSVLLILVNFLKMKILWSHTRFSFFLCAFHFLFYLIAQLEPT